MSRSSTRPRSRLRPWLLFGGALIALLSLRLFEQLRPEPLPVIAIIPAFSLFDQNGSSFDDTALRDRVWVASFIYTACPGPCPRLVRRVAKLQKDFDGDPRVRFLSFSVDPERDSTDVLAGYAKVHGIDGEQWRLLTGATGAVTGLVRDGFSLVLAAAGEEISGDDGPIIHSVHLVLVDGEMRVRGYYDSNDPEALERLAHDTGSLLDELPRP